MRQHIIPFLAAFLFSVSAHAGYVEGLAAYNKNDHASALGEWRRLLAEQGDARAQYQLGWMLERGEGLKQDYDQAVQWYKRAADQGHALAQINLGNMYNNGHAGAQYNLGIMYTRGGDTLSMLRR